MIVLTKEQAEFLKVPIHAVDFVAVKDNVAAEVYNYDWKLIGRDLPLAKEQMERYDACMGCFT